MLLFSGTRRPDTPRRGVTPQRVLTASVITPISG